MNPANAEYIYLCDLVWDAQHQSIPVIPFETIVTDVKYDPDEKRAMYFSFKLNGEDFKCHYGWAFCENTPENVVRMEQVRKNQQTIRLLQNRNAATYDEITLKKVHNER